jgi:hypothetical protein
LLVDLKTHRHDSVAQCSGDAFIVSHSEPDYNFTFLAVAGQGEGYFKHQFLREPGRSAYARIALEAHQPLVIGVGLDGAAETIEKARQAAADVVRFTTETEERVAAETADGDWIAPQDPLVTRLRDWTARGLHSCIDESGALRASIKAVYYLIWVRDAAFCFNYQAAAGWMHRHPEFCRFLLENPLHPSDQERERVPGLPEKMFGQLISKTYGKAEEDGLYYATWSAFTHWTQTGEDTFAAGSNLELLKECADQLERYIFDSDLGLFGEHFMDESPTANSRDCGWDLAIGQPTGERPINYLGRNISASFDIYINLLQHAVYSMLSAMDEGEDAQRFQEKADALWPKIEEILNTEGFEQPPYALMRFEDGGSEILPRFGSAKSVYFWALSLPIFAPIHGIDGIRARLLDELMDDPGGHWVNGICAVIAGLDTWVTSEEALVEAIRKVSEQSWRQGAYLPMGGAMPEKFDAPMGHNFHDIRPQAFAQSSWLAACANLGVRRLPFGLAARPTQFFSELSDYAWRGKALTFRFDQHNPQASDLPQLQINGQVMPHTLQLPEEALQGDAPRIALIDGGREPCLLRSTTRLHQAEPVEGGAEYHIQAFGSGELVFNQSPAEIELTDTQGQRVDLTLSEADGMSFARFSGRGDFLLRVIA